MWCFDLRGAIPFIHKQIERETYKERERHVKTERDM